VSILSPDVAWLNRAIPAPKHELFGFLTTEANSAVARVHPKATPVILRTLGKFDLWFERDPLDALTLQLPLPDDALRIVARGRRWTAPDRTGQMTWLELRLALASGARAPPIVR
jgi:putative SOS response-associated peptidase YedK